MAGATVIESPDRTDDDEVVGLVANDLELVFLPTENALLDEHFSRRRIVKRPLDFLVELIGMVDDRCARAAHREART
jgi:hypothetical protein